MKDKVSRKTTLWKWPTYVAGFLLLLLVSWCLILTYHPRFALKASETAVVTTGGSAKTENIGSEGKVTYVAKVVVPEITLSPKPKPKSKYHLDNVIAYGSKRFAVDGDVQVVKSQPFKTVTFNMNEDMPLLGPLPTRGIIYVIPSVHFFWKYSLLGIS